MYHLTQLHIVMLAPPSYLRCRLHGRGLDYSAAQTSFLSASLARYQTEKRESEGVEMVLAVPRWLLKSLLCHFQVCPAGWTPGSNTMKPTPKDSKDYFAAL